MIPSETPPMTTQNRRTFLQTSAAGAAAFAFSPLLEPIMAMPFSQALNVGVIGLGRQGRSIVGELAKMDNVTIAAVCDIDDSRLQSGLRRARGAEGFADHRELLDKMPDVQAVFVATPTHLHREIAVDALDAGRHVYCEAPLASTIEDCRAIVEASRNAGTVFQTGMQARSNPIYKLAWTFYQSGSVRDLVSMRAQRHEKTSWRMPASDPAREKAVNWRLDPEVSIGLVGEWGTHQFDVFHYYTRKYPVKVRGGGDIRLHHDGREIFDTCYADLIFDDGAALRYDATLANSYEDTYEQFHGTMGTIKLTWTHGWLFKEADAPTQGWEVYANRQRFHNEEGITLIADATQLAAQGRLEEGVGLPNDSLYYAVEDFLRSVDEDTQPVCTAEEGLRAAVVGILANKAVVTGDEVAIDPALLQV